MSDATDNEARTARRATLLRQIVDRATWPMAILGLVWLALLVIDLVWGLSPAWLLVSDIIWGIFVLEFVIELGVAPDKLDYLKRNWLTAIALFVPALRIFAVFKGLRAIRAVQAIRAAWLVRVVSSINRGARALGVGLERQGIAYVAGLTTVVTLAGAAGMYAFERNPPNPPGLTSYGDALWWTAMLMTTIASQYWPQTPEGRLLALILSFYALALLGYVAAALATVLVGREAEKPTGELPNARSVEQLREEIVQLREEVRALADRLPKTGA